MANPQDPGNDSNLLEQSWCDTKWIPFLTIANVMEYFASPTNPFYDKECNNEVVRMQRLDPSTVKSMIGVEYELIHAKDPILFVIRKQNRTSPTSISPISCYYILGGHIRQAPDLWTVVNSRLLRNSQTGNQTTFRPDITGARPATTAESAADYGSHFQRNNVNAIIDRVIRKHASSLTGGGGDAGGEKGVADIVKNEDSSAADEQMDVINDQKLANAPQLVGSNKHPLSNDSGDAGDTENTRAKRQRL